MADAEIKARLAALTALTPVPGCRLCGHNQTDHDIIGGGKCCDGRCPCPGYKEAIPSNPDLEEDVLPALAGKRGLDQQRIAAEGIVWLAILLRKNQDYGSAVWKRPMLAPDLEPRSAILVRMSDKIARLHQLSASPSAQVRSESYEDTMRDLAAYALLYLVAPKEEKEELRE